MRLILPIATALIACACSAPTPTPMPTTVDPTATAAQAPPRATGMDAPLASDSPAPGPVLATVPARFQGTWAADAAACGTAGHESRLAVSANVLEFHESRGTVKSLREDGASLLAVMELTGEGNTWEATRRLTLSSDGTTLSDGDSGIARVRCR